MITAEQISERLIEAIKQNGMTNAEIANELFFSKNNISRYISMGILPRLDTFANLCKVLDVSADYILCLDEYS